MPTTPAYDSFTALVQARRSNLRVDADRPVPAELIEGLCRLATLAPNHRRTEPWRFAVCTGAGRARVGAALEAALRARGVTDGARLAKARTKYLRAPVLLVVACAPSPDPVVAAEDRDAVAAGVAHILLGATALGLASLWSTGEAAALPEVREACGFDPGDTIVGLVYLGWPVEEAPSPGRTEPVVRFVGA